MPDRIPTSDEQAQQACPRVVRLLREGIEAGWHLGAQVHISMAGAVRTSFSIGFAEPGRPLQPDDLMLWLSSGKPLLAAVILRLVEQDQIELDRPVVDYLDDFRGGRKEQITVRHLLTHTAGIRPLKYEWASDDWKTIWGRIADMAVEPDWTPGSRAGYHVASSWFVLGELARRITGQHLPTLMREHILAPCGMTDSHVGLSPAEYAACADRLVPVFNTWRGQQRALDWHDEAHCTHVAPGANSRGPASQLAQFYEMLLASGLWKQQRVLQSESVRNMVSRHRVGLTDETFQQVLDVGLGVILDSKSYSNKPLPYGYGAHASPETFGHGGNQSSIGFADPQHQLVVAIVCNGMPGEPRHNQRNWALNTAVYEDLDLVYQMA